MKILLLFAVCVGTIYGQQEFGSPLLIDTIQIREAMNIHKTLAFTTWGLLLISDSFGLYHSLSMRKQGHIFRDEHGFDESNMSSSPAPSNEIKTVWNKSKS